MKHNAALRQGRLVAFEGIEGSGKTSQISKIAEWLRHPPVVTREPGGTPFADRVRRILLDPKNSGLSPHLELLLYEAARRDHCEKVIRPALHRGKTVLCDRFTDATIAYQGYGRGLKLDTIKRMNEQATGGIKPDLTILLDLPVSTGLKRSQRRLKRERLHEGRFEYEALALHRRVRRGYLALAHQNKKRFLVVDATGNPDQTFGRILKKLEGVLWTH